MSAKKQTSPDPVAADSAGAKRGKHWPIAIAVLVLMAGGGSYAVWQQVRSHVLNAAEYQIEPDKITISALPPWIHTDIKKEVLHEAAFDGPLSLVDTELTVHVAGAFAAHPWVAHVNRVSKRFPAGLDVVLLYRRPVAMVEVEKGTGALPVDVEGVVLPTQDFSAEDAEAYLRIGEIRTTPSGATGERWGDPAVTGAAQVAAALADDWKELGIYRIVPSGQRSGKIGVEYIFSLVTRGGMQIRWGRAPATDLPGELPAVEKISQLKRYAKQNNGTLDQPDGAQLEIRDDGALVSRPRPEVKPLPKAE
jgi:hypothetical protein